MLTRLAIHINIHSLILVAGRLPSLGLVLGITYQTVRHCKLSNNISWLIYSVYYFDWAHNNALYFV